MSAPPYGADRDRYARLLAAAEIARRGGSAREVRRAGRTLLAVTGAGGGTAEVRVVSADAAVPAAVAGEARIVVDAGEGDTIFHVLPPGADPREGIEPWRGRWELIGL